MEIMLTTKLVKTMLTRKIVIGLSVLLAGTVDVEAGSQVGQASYYASKNRTADGGHVGRHTAASPTLPLDSKARVTNLQNNRAVDVTVNDRGPYVGGRVIDVSPDAAKDLGFQDSGKAPVKVEPLPQ
jgi:rare lipoprotein A